MQSLFTYSDRARTLLYVVLRQYPHHFTSDLAHPISGCTDLRGLVAHMAGAEERWVQCRIQGKPLKRYEERASADLDTVFSDWSKIRATTYKYMSALTLNDYSHRVRTELTQGVPCELTVEEILFHILNHETHHRAQILWDLRLRDLDPPDFDYAHIMGEPNYVQQAEIVSSIQ